MLCLLATPIISPFFPSSNMCMLQRYVRSNLYDTRRLFGAEDSMIFRTGSRRRTALPEQEGRSRKFAAPSSAGRRVIRMPRFPCDLTKVTKGRQHPVVG